MEIYEFHRLFLETMKEQKIFDKFTLSTDDGWTWTLRRWAQFTDEVLEFSDIVFVDLTVSQAKSRYYAYVHKIMEMPQEMDI